MLTRGAESRTENHHSSKDKLMIFWCVEKGSNLTRAFFIVFRRAAQDQSTPKTICKKHTPL